MRRRDAISLIPLGFAGMAAGAGGTAAQNLRYDYPGVDAYRRTNPGSGPFPAPVPSPDGPLALRYTRHVRDMLLWIRETQSENLLEASWAMADTIKRGGRVWCAWDMGHNTYFDMFPERCGIPGIITMGYDPATAKKGDAFLASIWGGPHQDLVDKDILVIGGPAPWGGDARGQELLREDVKLRKLKPYSKIWIETNISTLGAIMQIPGQPAPHGPVSGIIGMTTYWMMLADACRILARDGHPVPVSGDEPALGDDASYVTNLDDPLMDDYFERVMLQIEMIGSELGDIDKIADMAVDTVLEGGKVYVYSRYRNSLAVEAHHRRGGLCLTRGLCDINGTLTPLDGGAFSGSAKDLVIMGVWEPDDEVDLAHLDTLRRAGVKLASIGPMTRDTKVPEGRAVPKETDVHIGRMMDTYGIYALPGFERKVCPTSGPLINQLYWSTTMQIVERMILRTGDVPGVFFSAALKNGNSHNAYMMAKYHERGF